MTSIALYSITAILLFQIAKKLSATKNSTSLMVLILIYYHIIFIISAIFPNVITDQGIPLAFESELNLEAAATFTSGALLISAGAYFPNILLRSSFKYSQQKRIAIIDDFRISCILILCALFSITSLLISGASSYSEYVEGGIGLKVTTALLAAGALPAAVVALRGRNLGAALLFYSLPCLAIAIETGVRLMVLVPVGTIICSYIMRSDSNILSSRNSVIAILSIFPLTIVNGYILIPLRGSESSILNLPDSNVIGWFLAYYDRVGWGETWSLDPIIRFINGYFSYPLSKMGYNPVLADDPAHTWARDILMVEGGAYHMPMTFALDLKVSAGPMFWASAFLIGVILFALDALSRISETSRILFTPCIVITSFLIARGSLTHAGTSVAAVIVFATIITIAIQAVSLLRLRKTCVNGSVIGQANHNADFHSS